MTNVMNEIGEYLTYILITVFALGWLDTLWIFGVENSKEYTWWYLIQQLAN
jgi:exonuclease III|tara:strand:+ start:278 stop:430 length:153 start_codon:yes stop_codon:yes gene_type:complete